MLKLDARKRSTEIQQHNREQAIRLYLDGRSREDIARIVDVHVGTVGEWIRRYQKGGLEAISTAPRGRRVGKGRTLTPAQEQRLKDILIDKSPEQVGVPFALWSSTAIRALVKKYWLIDLPQRTVSLYMKRWDFTPQKGAKRADERSDAATKKWLTETYPGIKKRAARQGGTIFWGDETGVSNQCQHSRGYAPRGKTPLVSSQAKRFRVNLISAVNNQGKLRFMLYQETLTTRVLLRFMKRLIKEARRKVFLILDNLRVHHAKLVKAWLERHKDEIEVYYLPSYSPDMNPDEYLNGDLKQAIRASSPARSQAQLERKVLSHMRKLQALPERIKRYFHHDCIQYAL